MNFPIVILIGVVLGALDGVGIFFEPKEPYKWQILCAATLKGAIYKFSPDGEHLCLGIEWRRRSDL